MATVTQLQFKISSAYDGGAVDRARQSIAALNRDLDQLSNKSVKVTVAVDNSSLTRLKAQLDEISRMRPTVKVEISDTGVVAKINEIKARLDSLHDKTVHVRAEYDSAPLSRAASDLTRVGTSANHSSHEVEGLASKLGGPLIAAAIGLGSALIPLSAGLLAVSAGAVSMATSAAAGLGAFGLAVKLNTSNLNDMKTGLVGIHEKLVMADEVLGNLTPHTAAWNKEQKVVVALQDQYTHILAQASPVQRAYLLQLIDMHDAQERFRKSTEALVLPVLTTFLAGITQAFGKLLPLVTAVAPLAMNVATSFRAWVAIKMDSWVNFMKTNAVPVLANFITIGKNLGRVLGDMIKAFAPLGRAISESLAVASAKLKGWADGGGFQRFLEYVRANGPRIRDLMVALGGAVKVLLEAMKGLGGISLNATILFLKVIAAMSPGEVQALAVGFLALKGALAVSGLINGAVEGFKAMKAAIIAVKEATIGTRIELAALWLIQKGMAIAELAVTAGLWLWFAAQTALDFVTGLFAAILDSLGIGEVLLLIGLIIAALIFLLLNWRTVWNAIKASAIAIWDAIKVAWNALIRAIEIIFGTLTTKQTWIDVWNAMKVAAMAVWDALKTAWQAFINFFPAAWTATSSALKTAWDAVWNALKTAATAVWTAMETAWRAFVGVLASAWTATSSALSTAWSAVWNAMGTAVKAIWSGMQTAWTAFVNALKTAWTTTSAALSAAWNALWNGMKTAATAVWNALKTAWDAFVNAIRAAYNAFSSAMQSSWNTFWNFIKTVANAAWSALKTSWEAFFSFVRGIYNAFASAMQSSWNAFWSVIKTVANAAWSALKTSWNAFYDFIKGIFNAFSSAMKSSWDAFWNAIKAVGNAAWSALKTSWKAFYDFIRGIFNSFADAMKKSWDLFWGALKEATKLGVDAIKAAWNVIKAIFRDPIVAIVNIVYTHGIKALWDPIAKIFNAPQLPPAPTIPNFAVGGPVNGPGTGTSDSIPARLSAGEHVWTAKEVEAAGGHDKVAAIRSAVIGGHVRTMGPKTSPLLNGRWAKNVYAGFPTGGGVQPLPRNPLPGIGPGAGGQQGSGNAPGATPPPGGVLAIGGNPFPNGSGTGWADSAFSVLEKLVLGGIGIVVNPALDAVGKAGKTLVNAIIPGSGSPLETLVDGMIDVAIKSIKDFITSRDIAPTTGGGNTAGAQKWADAQIGKPYQLGGFGSTFDCSSFMSGIARVILGQAPAPMFTTFAFTGAKQGPATFEKDLKSPFMVGVENVGIGHMAGTLNGKNYEATPPAVRSGPNARGATNPMFSMIYGMKAAIGGGQGVIPSGQHLAIIDAAMKAAGVPPPNTQAQWEAGLNTLITRESAWNSSAVNNTDSNAAAGHPSQGLAQVIPSTFAAFHVAGTSSNILDPVANVAAAIRYIVSKYGGITNVQQANASLPPKGYAMGTNNATAGWHRVGENGPEWVRFHGGERVLPHGRHLDDDGDHIEFHEGAFQFDLRGATKEAIEHAQGPLTDKLRMAIQAGVGKRRH